MNSNTVSAIVVAVEFALRAVCVYAILRVTLTMFKINKTEKLEKERDAALAWLKAEINCDACAYAGNVPNCPILEEACTGCADCPESCKCKTCNDASNWAFGGKFPDEVYGDDDGRAS